MGLLLKKSLLLSLRQTFLLALILLANSDFQDTLPYKVDLERWQVWSTLT